VCSVQKPNMLKDLDTAENRSEMPWKLNVVLKKDGEDQLEWSCEKRKSITKHQGGKECLTYNKQKKGLTGLVTSCIGIAF